MTDAVIFPDVEALLLAYLKPLVAPVKVVTKVPAARPASFVKLVRVGGPAETGSPTARWSCSRLGARLRRGL